ncbi:MAG: polyamine aminopropyltransferase [Alphaproteobacteria bacterium]|nr:polyamine aminopropyltransferase [Alphaproteobacteria bacterium]
MSEWFEEGLHLHGSGHGYAQRFQVTKEIYREKTEFQDLVIFETPTFGRVLALDGVIQTTEKDEFIYHEMMAHVPIIAHGNAKNVLIIGGGDGGVLREVLKHPLVSPTMVELDRSVVDLCIEYMPSLSDGAFENPRTELLITDGIKFVAETDRQFDVIIVDSTDPIGPGEVLFTEAFYKDCKRCLGNNGILITQNGVPIFQPDEVTTTFRRLSPHFKDASFFVAPIPTYVGGYMTLGWATMNKTLRQHSTEILEERVVPLSLQTKYYNAAVHNAAFALPEYIKNLKI